MARILAIDYGTKRTGIAVTDPAQIIATALETVATKDLMVFLKQYLTKEEVECIVIGDPKRMDNSPSSVSQAVQQFVKQLAKSFPAILLELVDERFTSKMAFQSMIDSGLKKKDRQDKSRIDRISATIILQGFLESKKYRKN